MEQIINNLRRKSKIMYDINCISKYIKGGDYDARLKTAWDDYQRELAEIEKELSELRKPGLEEFEHEKLTLLSHIKEHENEIKNLKQQLKDLNKLIYQLGS